MLELKLDVQRQEVKIGESVFTLEEMTQAQTDAYIDSNNQRAIRNEKGDVVAFKNQAGFKADLLSRCLKDSSGVLVSAKTIQDWPSSVVDALHVEAQKINGFTVKKAEPEKKDSAAQP